MQDFNWKKRGIKYGPNDRNILTQDMATLLGATCCVHLATLLQRVATCWVLQIELERIPWCKVIARAWPNEYSIMQHPQMLHEKFDHFKSRPTNRNISTQHCWAQHVERVWPPCFHALRCVATSWVLLAQV